MSWRATDLAADEARQQAADLNVCPFSRCREKGHTMAVQKEPEPEYQMFFLR
jgi:hypothetical protein